MSFVEEHERRAGRRHIAGCGCAVIAVAAIILFGLSALILTLGDCGSEVTNCHADSNRLLGRILWSIGAIGIGLTVALAWWANKSPKDD
jgi:Co/Zn/Cd efflux system component